MSDQTADPTVIPITSSFARGANEDKRQGDEVSFAPPQNSTANPNGDPASRTSRGAQFEDDQSIRLSDIRLHGKDGRGMCIKYIYAHSDDYVIYHAGDEVMVQFADDLGRAREQRKSLLALSSARAEVSALVQGLSCRAVCDRQLAYALQIALDGDIEGAREIVATAKSFVLAKRAAGGRFQYLKWSFGTAAVLSAIFFAAGHVWPFGAVSNDLWLAGTAGLVGSAFSIALAIRNRTVALDTDWLDNVTDGVLRLLIGVISAGVLLLLLFCGVIPTLKLGDASFGGTSLSWQMVLIIGFVGGFLERLVPDLLNKNLQTSGGNALNTAMPPRG